MKRMVFILALVVPTFALAAEGDSAAFLETLDSPDVKTILVEAKKNMGEPEKFCALGPDGVKAHVSATGGTLARARAVAATSVATASGPSIKYFKLVCAEAGK